MAIRVVTTKEKPWKSLGSEREIEAEKAALEGSKGGKLRLHFSTRRDVFIKRRAFHSFMNRDAVDDGSTFYRSKEMEAGALVQRQEVDYGVQAVPPCGTSATQTPYHRKVHAAIQAEPAVVDARVPPGQKPEATDPRIKKFFGRVMPRMLHHLTQAVQVPIFTDDYVSLADDDTAFAGAREESSLREVGNYFHHHTRDRHITSIDWRPGNKSIIAVSSISQGTLAERFAAAAHVESSTCVVWNFLEQANPQFVLDAPAEVLVLKFCPTKPHLIVGGLTNGQVVLWDLTKAPDTRTRYSKQSQKARAPAHGEDVTAVPPMPPPTKGHTLERSGDHLVSRLLPVQVSRLEGSHRRGVHDISWLPEQLECSFDGKLVPATDGQNQFGTISDDGAMCIWDLRPDNLPDHKARKLRHGRVVPGEDKVWVPLLRFTLAKPDGSGDVLGFRFHLEGKTTAGQPSYHMAVTTLEGEFCVCNWAPRDATPATFDNDGRKVEAKLVRAVLPAHAGPGWAVQRHPLLPDYYLTVGDWGFKVWKVGLDVPLLASPHSEQQVMCGRWSPTRAAVLLVGTKDGWVQVWDLLDRSHERLLATQVTQEAITCLEFKPLPERRQSTAATQQLIVGTRRGEFRLYELPRVLVRGHTNETRATRQFFEREARRVAYFAWRWQERQDELDLRRQETAEAAPGQKAAAETDDETADYAVDPEADQAFLDLVKELNQDEDGPDDDADENA